MRSLRQSPVVRVVRSQRPYSSARERWKERMDMQRRDQQGSAAQQSAGHGIPADQVPDERLDQSLRRDTEEREPSANECAPLRFSEDERGESSVVVADRVIRQRLDSENTAECRLSHRHGLQGNERRMSLVSLFRTPAGQLINQGSADVATMDQRFQSMSVVQQQGRRRAQRALKQEKSVATRRRVLMSILGMKRFYKTLSLVREIKGIREKLLLQCATDTRTPTNIKKVMVCKVKFDNLPKSGRDLMARTHLVAAIEHTEVERLSKLPWDELILEAQKNVISYQEWMSISETRE